MKESHLVSQIIQWAHWQKDLFVWRNNTGAFKLENGNYLKAGLKGSSDIIGVGPRGLFLGIEAKSDKGRMSDHQIAFKLRVEAAGGVFILARKLDDVILKIEELRGAFIPADKAFPHAGALPI